MQYVYRYSIKPGKVTEHLEWIRKNRQVFQDHAPEGWTYLGTWFTVQGFGPHDAESRWELEDYGSLGTGFGDEENQRLLAEFISEYQDDVNRPQVSLMKSMDEVSALAGV